MTDRGPSPSPTTSYRPQRPSTRYSFVGDPDRAPPFAGTPLRLLIRKRGLSGVGDFGVEALLRLLSIPYDVLEATAGGSLCVDLPLLEDHGVIYRGFDAVLSHLSSYGHVALTPDEKAEAQAFMALVNTSLAYTLGRDVWLDEDVVSTRTMPCIKEDLCFPIRRWYVQAEQERVRILLSGRSEDRIRSETMHVLQHLSIRLGEEDWFFQGRSSPLDAVVWGLLAAAHALHRGIVWESIQSHGNLLQFYDRVVREFFPEG